MLCTLVKKLVDGCNNVNYNELSCVGNQYIYCVKSFMLYTVHRSDHTDTRH